MSHSLCKLIEFYGGPVDGCAELFKSPLEQILVVHSTTDRPSNHWALRILRFVSFRDPWKVTPVYFYQLTERTNGSHYKLVGFGSSANHASQSGAAIMNGEMIELQLARSLNCRLAQQLSDAPASRATPTRSRL